MAITFTRGTLTRWVALLVVLAGVALVTWWQLRESHASHEQETAGQKAAPARAVEVQARGTDLSPLQSTEHGATYPAEPLPATLGFDEDLLPEVQKDVTWLLTQDKIDSQVRLLSQEALHDSVGRLANVKMYFYPGVRGSSFLVAEFPLPRSLKQEQSATDQVMSNRRFIKVLYEMASLPAVEAERLLNEQVSSTLPVFNASFQSYMEARKELFQPNSKLHGPSFQISDNADGSPTLLGMRFQLLSLLLVAGNTPVEGAAPAVLAVAREAAKQRQLLYDTERFDARAAHGMLVYASLYNRQIVGTALIRTCMSADNGTELAKRLGLEWRTQRLPRYDAKATPYDVHARIGAVPVDYSKGEISVSFLGPVSDTEFDAILEKAASSERQ